MEKINSVCICITQCIRSQTPSHQLTNDWRRCKTLLWGEAFSRLVSAQYSRNGHELAYCHYFLHGFKGQAIEGQCTRLEDAKRRRDDHEKECFRHGGQKTSFPEDPCVKFGALEKQVRDLPFLFLISYISSNQITLFPLMSR